jgi:hypothetical protein
MKAVRTEPEIAMHAVVDTLHTYFEKLVSALRFLLDKLMSSPHHLMIYIAAAAVLLVCIPLARALFGSRSQSQTDVTDDSALNAASPSMLGLSSPGLNTPGLNTPGLNTPRIDFKPAASIARAPSPAQNPIPSNVTAINESLTVECIHCGVTMPSREDFCPACGYAQPVKQSLAAAFPA